VGFKPRASVTTPQVKLTVADTLGAGNTFQAALLTWAAETSRLMPGCWRPSTTRRWPRPWPLPPAPRP
jgi:sugar/nucleoside kinase (ribokinase family)